MRVFDSEARPGDDQPHQDPLLVRPYVSSIDVPPDGDSPAVANVTMLLPVVPASADPVAMGSTAIPSRRPASRRPARRSRATIVVAASAVLIVAASVLYLHGRGGVALAIWSATPVRAAPSATAIVSRAPSPATSPTVTASTAAPRNTKAPARSRPATPSSAAATDAPKGLFGAPSAKPSRAASTNLAAGRPVIDSGHIDGYSASNAVDGNPMTYWESTNQAFPQSITVDLGTTVSVSRLVLRLPPLAIWPPRTETLSVSGSVDNDSFTEIVGTTGYPFDVTTGNAVTIAFRPAPVRYVRLTFVANSVQPAGQAAELEVWAS